MRTWSLILLLAIFIPLPQAFGGTALPLSEKLSQQFARYEAAREKLLTRLADPSLPPEQRRVERDEWEAWLAAPSDQAMTESDIANLRASQRQRIAAAHAKAIQASTIDLERFRRLPQDQAKAEVTKFCAALPKGAMLHIHPYGTLTRETSLHALQANDPVLPLKAMLNDFETPGMLLYPAELQWFKGLGPDQRFSMLQPADQSRYLDFFALPPGNHPFERFQSVFDFVMAAVPNPETETALVLDFARRAVAEGVLFVEFRMDAPAAALPHLAAMLERVEAETGLVIRIDVAFMRTTPESQRDAVLADLLSLPPNLWVVGIDLLANERNTPALETAQVVYGSVLQAVRDGRSNLHRTMHAGELGDVRNPRDAIILGAERLGHGVLLNQDPVTLEYAARHQIPVEINLVSNLRLEAIDDLTKHPFLDYLRLGLPVSLSTDDEGILDTDIDNECVVAIETSDVTYAELKQMTYNSLTTAFVQDEKRQELLQRLDGQFAAFEQQQQQQRQTAGF